MKVVSTVARILLGVIFLFFGSNIVFHFLPTPPPPPGPQGQFITAMFASHYIIAVGVFQMLGGLLVLIPRFIPLGLTILAPVLVNILLFHIFMAPESIIMGLIATLLWLVVYWRVRASFAGILRAPGA